MFSGNALGIGLGALMALQLFVTTNWLVLRGTAPYSKNAALLSQYLPGYTVSFAGSLVGALELFAAVVRAVARPGRHLQLRRPHARGQRTTQWEERMSAPDQQLRCTS